MNVPLFRGYNSWEPFLKKSGQNSLIMTSWPAERPSPNWKKKRLVKTEQDRLDQNTHKKSASILIMENGDALKKIKFHKRNPTYTP